MKAIFQFRDTVLYQSKKQIDFQILPVLSVFSGTERIKVIGPKTWEILSHEINYLENLKKFKKAIKQWKTTSCPHRLFKTYTHRLGFFYI